MYHWPALRKRLVVSQLHAAGAGFSAPFRVAPRRPNTNQRGDSTRRRCLAVSMCSDNFAQIPRPRPRTSTTPLQRGRRRDLDALIWGRQLRVTLFRPTDDGSASIDPVLDHALASMDHLSEVAENMTRRLERASRISLTTNLFTHLKLLLFFLDSPL
jgi:hypothetical protein